MLKAAGLAITLAAQAAAPITVPAPFAVPDPAARVLIDGDHYTLANGNCVARPIGDGLRQRLIDVAAAEWARFSYPVYDNRHKNVPAVNVRGGTPLIDHRLNPVRPGIAREMARLGRMEDDRAVRAAIGGYWTTVPNAVEVLTQQNDVFAIYGGSGWVQPWSAAFISYVECAAGVADPAQFVRSDGHYRYVDQAIATATGTAQGIYKARDLDTGLPTPGDLLCADRAAPPNYTRIADRTDTAQRDMHCDLVVKVVTGRHGYVALIGGNVINAATMTLVNIVPKKGKAPAHVEGAADIQGGRPWFAVLALQAGGIARLEDTRAIRGLETRP